MKTYALICQLLLLGLAGFAQDAGALTVEVIDKAEQEPLVFAVVILMEDGVIRYGSQTDFDGRAEIKEIAPGEYMLETRFLGEESKRIPIRIEADKTIFLKVEMTFIEIPICEWPVYENLFPNDWSGQTWSANEIRRSPYR